jgi:hypothetical protein
MSETRRLAAAFVRSAGERDRIDVTRSDGSQVSWPFPTYGDGLPHDLVHLVVESAFGLKRGFWGRVDEGADPKRISEEANRIGGRDKYAAFGEDQGELQLAEALAQAPWSAEAPEVRDRIAAACVAAGVEAPPMDDETIARTKASLARLAKSWRDLLPKGALNVSFDPEDPEASLRTLGT